MLTFFERLRLRAKLIFGRLYTTRAVVGVVIEEEGKYLLLDELRDGKYFLNIPAGHIDPRETPIEAAIREAKEESGLEVELTGLRIVLSNTWDNGLHSVYWIFDGKPVGGDVRPEEGSRAAWLTLEEWKERMKKIEPMPAVPYVLDAVEKGMCIPMEAVYFIDRRKHVSRQTL